jgi:predicted ester cyclase
MVADPGLRERREAVIRAHVDAEKRHDAAGVATSFHRPRYDVPAMGPAGQADGAEAVQALMAGIFAAFPDWDVEAGPLYHADDAVFLEARMTGTQQGEFAGIRPTGRRMDVRLAAIFDFEGDRLLGERVFFDFATVLQQLGAMPASVS